MINYLPTKFLRDCWKGIVPLKKVFWTVYFSSRISALIIFAIVLAFSGVYWQTTFIIYVIVTVSVLAWSWHVLWRNSVNTENIFFRYFCRALIITEFCYILWLAY